ncbi:MAG TPA: DEAD/DEAH box helicase, partial [Hyphomicrobium zavarzinii]|nr:DEAD/DEAH box helicase [Hyphomicrobium zavarzinii]
MTFPTSHPALARALASRNYSVPTAVQSAVLEAEASGRDMLVSAQTGSGKTVAFGLAMAATMLGENERFEPAAEPLALIIAPTRELAMQVQRELAWLYAETGARVVTCVGGMDARAEARQLGFGAHIVVGTPGRLRDHLERRRLDLSKLKTIVLDEADEMLDLGFREDLEFILDATPETRQTLLFSATMPREIEALASRYQRDALRIETLRRNEQHADIEYRAIRVAPFDIENAVVNVLRLHEARAAIVFCATREGVKRLHARLVERGFSAVALSGELTQNERSQALVALRDGRARVLVATDVAARGLDLPDLALVIHAELPHDHETLLHRSGRTGRAGKKGLCVLVVPFNRRRKAEALLAAARLKVTWAPAPTAEEIRARDQERFLSDPIFTDAATDEDLALVGS